MFSSLLRFLAIWQVSMSTTQEGLEETALSAVDACVLAVEAYFPCDGAVDHQCLCEQYMWRLSCYDQHAPLAHPSRRPIATSINHHCRSAGSLEAAWINDNMALHRRQVETALSSLVGEAFTVTSLIPPAETEVTGLVPLPNYTVPVIAPPSDIAVVITGSNGQLFLSYLKSTSEPVPATPPANSAPSGGEALPTESGAWSGSATPGASANSARTSSTSSPAPGSSSGSSGSSGPSAGLIAGAVIGSVAVLVLIGILVMLILRHKRKQKASTPTDGAVEIGGAGVGRGADTSPAVDGAGEKGTQGKYSFTQEGEMPTSANVWELEGHVLPADYTLPHIYNGPASDSYHTLQSSKLLPSNFHIPLPCPLKVENRSTFPNHKTSTPAAPATAPTKPIFLNFASDAAPVLCGLAPVVLSSDAVDAEGVARSTMNGSPQDEVVDCAKEMPRSESSADMERSEVFILEMGWICWRVGMETELVASYGKECV
ncbi:hypothetical protein IQ07DRAFT_664064 [Pyrenochaeta sp. DS3sAY3a]|nr:hypothetical protein IQ07DRAFT_664064 [Pyrenochaeta sp. DS3sAY3a]